MFRQSENFTEAQRATLGRASGDARTSLGKTANLYSAGRHNHLADLLIYRMPEQLLKADRQAQRPVFRADCPRSVYPVLIGIAFKHVC